MKNYRLVLEPDDNGTFLVTCPELPEVTTFGETEEACVRNGADAIEEAIAARIACGAELPTAPDMSPVSGSKILSASIGTLAELKIDLYRALRSSGMTRAELARKLDWNRNSVDRLFRLDHASRLEQIETAAAVLGLQVKAEIVERAKLGA